MHYASSVFEGERAYNGKIFKSREHSERLKRSAEMIDFKIPYTIDEIEAAKAEVLAASGLQDAYVRAVAWRGVGEDMGVASARNPVRMAIACSLAGASGSERAVYRELTPHAIVAVLVVTVAAWLVAANVF